MPGLLLLVRENNTRSPKVTLNWSRRQARSAWFLKYYCIMLIPVIVGRMHARFRNYVLLLVITRLVIRIA
jgi:hypothetical protein